jgi:hypothetical protein
MGLSIDQVLAEYHQFEEELDPDPKPHKREKLDLYPH